MARVCWNCTAVVIWPPLWAGVAEAVPVGDGYQRARFWRDVAGEWPLIEPYDRKRPAHKGLMPLPVFQRTKDEAARLCVQAGDDLARLGKHVEARGWLERFMHRLNNEANLGAKGVLRGN